MKEEQKMSLIRNRDTYLNDFSNNIMPFWIKYGMDNVNGGVFTCLDRTGTLMDSTKSVWFQGRFGYIASLAYNKIDHKQEWLDAAKSCIDFIESHCIDSDGHMFFSVTGDGHPIQKRRYVFSECFAAIAFAEYSKASGNIAYKHKALDMFKNIIRMLETPGFLPPKTLVPAQGHSIVMMLINVANVIREVIDAPELEAQVDKSLYSLEHHFMHPEFDALLETVGPNGEFMDTSAGRTINPGHCMETSWFIMQEAFRRKGDKHLMDLALTIYDWSWDWGWDEKYGGIINFRDCRNFPHQDYSQDMKFWWPQCETIISSLYCYLATKEDRYLENYLKVHDYTYRHFPDDKYPEWYGYLHRDGTIAQDAKGNLFKGPFHIPRMMIYASSLIDRIINNK